MKDMSLAFKKLESGDIVQIVYQQVNFHINFGVKMGDFRRKAMLVAGEHVTEPPETITVRIALKLAAPNELPGKVAYIQNAYITNLVTEKIYTFLGQEFGEDAGRKAIVVRSLYGLSSAGAAFRNQLAYCRHNLGFFPCPVGLDLWMKPMVRPGDIFDYYVYVLLYLDDLMLIHHDAESVIWLIDKYFNLKPSSIGEPDIYLGAKLKKMRLDNGVW